MEFNWEDKKLESTFKSLERIVSDSVEKNCSVQDLLLNYVRIKKHML